MKRTLKKTSTLILATGVLLLVSASAFAQATVNIFNNDSAGVGFNDTTPATPVGGNNGTTVGQQRLIVFQTVASIWGAALNSGPTITIRASWSSTMPCAATSGTLGSAGNSGNIWRDFPGGVPATWYGNALANAISNQDRNGLGTSNPEISATFNSQIGIGSCLTGAHWYYGLDNNHGSDGIDLLSVVLHEVGHGLGFQTYTNTSTGQQAGSQAGGFFPSIFDNFLFDDTTSKFWKDMSDSERVASAINTGNLVWRGPQVSSDVPTVLSGTPRLRVNSPASIGGNYQIFTADFGPAVTSAGTTGSVTQTTPNDGCGPITNSVAGKIAFIDRGTCTFVTKTRNAQNAGAIGVIIADNAGNPNGPLAGLGGGPDATITIPAIGISVADGNTIRTQLVSPGVNATLFADQTTLAGTDASARPRMYAPSQLASGSSVSHWDTSLTPNQVMEPNISNNLFHRISPPLDLTLSLLRDIGWQSNVTAAPASLVEDGAPSILAALDSVTHVRGPFSNFDTHNLNNTGDTRTRIILFTSDLGLNPTDDLSVLTVSASGIPLAVETVGPNDALPGTSYIIVRLDGLPPGNYALTVTLRGVNSTNAPTITIQ